jgi:hypothetical protein
MRIRVVVFATCAGLDVLLTLPLETVVMTSSRAHH